MKHSVIVFITVFLLVSYKSSGQKPPKPAAQKHTTFLFLCPISGGTTVYERPTPTSELTHEKPIDEKIDDSSLIYFHLALKQFIGNKNLTLEETRNFDFPFTIWIKDIDVLKSLVNAYDGVYIVGFGFITKQGVEHYNSIASAISNASRNFYCKGISAILK